MIRKATIYDMPQLLEIGIKFHKVSGWQNYISLDLKDLAEMIGVAIEDGGVFIHEHGAIAGFKTPCWFNRNNLMIQELFWWAEQDGLPLLKAFEEWAKTTEAKVLLLASMVSLTPERIDKIYTRRGYNKMEQFYLKRL